MNSALLTGLANAFKAEPPIPSPTGMTFEQRAALIGVLYSLRESRGMSLNDWGLNLYQALNYAEVTKILAEEAKNLAEEAKTLEAAKNLAEEAKTLPETMSAGEPVAPLADIPQIPGSVGMIFPSSRRRRNEIR
jgi:hypothetical protein